MATTTIAIFDALQELLESEFEEFKWWLSSGVDSIPRGKLQKANRHEVVDIMVQQYGTSNAGMKAVKALRSIKQNENATKLDKILQNVSLLDSEEAGAGAAGAEGSSGAGAAGAGVSSGAGLYHNVTYTFVIVIIFSFFLNFLLK